MGTRSQNDNDVQRLSPEDRARVEGFAISHVAGCPGAHLPGIGILWDERLPDERKHAFLDFLITTFAARTASRNFVCQKH
jgi:hypothetical protein